MSDDEYSPENSEEDSTESTEESEEELSEEEQEMLEEYARNLNKRSLEKDEDNNSNKKNKQEFEDLFKFIIINMNNPISINDSCSNFNTLSGEEDKTLSQETQETDKSLDTLQEPVFGPSLPISKTNQSLKFNKTFDTLLELINLGETYDPSIAYECNINIEKLHRIVEPLKELNNMIGLDKFKKSIIDQIVYILTLNLSSTDDKPMLHTCIYGPPGCGKTQISTILAKIYSSCGLLSGNKFKVVKREDFVAGYLGQTAIKTKKLLESMIGGVLFLDEAYSMGSLENRDYFAKEAIDTLNVFLSENYANFILIIAGYEKDIKECFFAQNSGLERRFPYRFTIDGYSSSELSSIFFHFVSTNEWKLADGVLNSNYLNEMFNKHMSSFPFYAGDVKTFFDKCKIVHTKKLIFLDKSQWKILTKKDIKEGFDLYLQERPLQKDVVPLGMYL